jgi:hypothetical protein
MAKPTYLTAKAGGHLGSRLEFFTVKTSLDVQPGLITNPTLPAGGVDAGEIVKETAGQLRLDYFVQTVNLFAQPVILTMLPVTAADGNGDTQGFTFALEHVGATDVARLGAALAGAIVAAGDAADLAAAAALITVTAQ